MSKPLPDCAWCGGSLIKCNRTVTTWTKIKERPTVGWHIVCTELDPTFKAHVRGVSDPAGLLKSIRERGLGRIVRLVANNEKAGCTYAYQKR